MPLAVDEAEIFVDSETRVKFCFRKEQPEKGVHELGAMGRPKRLALNASLKRYS